MCLQVTLLNYAPNWIGCWREPAGCTDGASRQLTRLLAGQSDMTIDRCMTLAEANGKQWRELLPCS
jgi:hypothetical protein